MSTETTQLDYGELRHTIGRVEGRVESLAEGQREVREEMRAGQNELREEMRAGQNELREEMRAGQNELREEMRAGQNENRSGFAEMNRRIDRLFYAILAFGGGVVAAVLADRFISGS